MTPPTASSRVAHVAQHRRKPWGTRFTLHGRHIAKLDRFVGQAQRAARRAEREFEGISIEVDVLGTVSVYAVGMTPMPLCPMASPASSVRTPRPVEPV